MLLGFLLGACTVLQPRDIPMDFAQECTSIECIVDAVDALRDDPSYGGTRFSFMNGHKDTYLRGLLESDSLSISQMNPLLIPLGVLGYATMTHGPQGGVARCGVRYAFDSTYIIVHELLHCQGYKDKGFLNPLWFQDRSYGGQ